MSSARFFVLKFSSLLHDTPWKPWVLSLGFKGEVGRVIARVRGSSALGEAYEACRGLVREFSDVEADAHEYEAAALAFSILRSVAEDIAISVVREILSAESVTKRVDVVAASMDRWIITYVLEDLKSLKVVVEDISYANILDPRFRYKGIPHRVEPRKVCEYVRELVEIVERVRDLPLPTIYNLAYLLIEPLWYRHCSGCVPVADTRVPTHTVFDHLYATASISNWFVGGEWKGFLVKIDIPGIQKFISSARKARDLWAGSWLISLIAWETVSEAVALLGADIVLSPFTPANPFFVSKLLEELRQRGKTDLVEKIEILAKESYMWRGAPNQPVIPGTLFLALPCLDSAVSRELESYIHRMDLSKTGSSSIYRLVKALESCDAREVEKYFYERFKEVWKSIASSTLEAYAQTLGSEEEIVKSFVESIKEFLDLDENSAREYLSYALRSPPLTMRIVVVDVSKEVERVREELDKIVEEIGLKDISKEELLNKVVFHYLYRKALPEREKSLLSDKISVEPGFILARELTKITETMYRASRGVGYRECTICGKLPSLIYVRDAYRVSEALGLPVSMFSEGERLCPYCLIKRLMTVDKALKNVLNKLRLYVNKDVDVYPRVPSTDELANTDNLLKIIDVLARERDLLDSLYREATMNLCGSRRISYRGFISEVVGRYIEIVAGADTELREKLISVIECLEARLELSYMMASDAIRSVERCKRVVGGYGLDEHSASNICELLSAVAVRSDIESRRYYAIVRGDGDYFGKKIVQGVLDFESVSEYIDAIIDAVRTDDIKRYRDLVRSYGEKIVEVAHRLTHGAKSLKPVVIVTPTYYMALSRGQMITALLDAEIVRALGGFPVYVGGDDVAAIAPTSIEKGRLDRLVSRYIEKEGLKNLSIGLVADNIPVQIVTLTRRNFWGLLTRDRDAFGFHVMPVSSVYPAPVAFGRSYGVLSTHYRDLFSVAWGLAGALEEVKDVVRFKNRQTGESLEKDVIAMSYGRVSSYAPGLVGIAVVRNTSYSKSYMFKNNTDLSVEVGRPVELAVELLNAVLDRSLSVSLFYDFMDQCYLLRFLPSADESIESIAIHVTKTVFERNMGRGREGVKSFTRDLVRRLLEQRLDLEIPGARPEAGGDYEVEVGGEYLFKIPCGVSGLVNTVLTTYILYSMLR